MDNLIFYVIAGGTFLFSWLVRNRLLATYNRYSQVPNTAGLPGAHVARHILNANALRQVRIDVARGKLADHYDPRSLTIRLSELNYRSASVAAMAISAHECGHAIQDAVDYGPLEFRTRMAPVATAGARFGIPAAILGSVFGVPLLVQVGVLGYLGAILLHFVTLPVEFDASKRALAQLQELGMLRGEETEQARRTLRAAAMTYVAGVASSAGYIVYIAIVGGRALLGKPKPPPPIPKP